MILLLAALCLPSQDAPAGRALPPRDLDVVTAETDAAIGKGLRYLAGRQSVRGSVGSGQYAENVAVSSVAGLAWLSSGSVPGAGPYGGNLDRVVDFVLASAKPSGYLVVETSTTHGPMYDHGFGTLFLAEVYGMTGRGDVRDKLKKAVRLIVDTQNREGGWRYKPQREPVADLSVTICQIMALRAARNAGIAVPKTTVDRTVGYVRRSQNPDGGFRYMLANGPSAFPRSAAGVVALHNAGVYEGKELERGLKYLARRRPGDRRGRELHFFYGHYYAVQAMFQEGGPHWAEWYPRIRDALVARQRGADGSWSDEICPEYGTAMALIILQVPNAYLPIFQR